MTELGGKVGPTMIESGQKMDQFRRDNINIQDVINDITVIYCIDACHLLNIYIMITYDRTKKKVPMNGLLGLPTGIVLRFTDR